MEEPNLNNINFDMEINIGHRSSDRNATTRRPLISYTVIVPLPILVRQKIRKIKNHKITTCRGKRPCKLNFKHVTNINRKY